MPFVRFSCLLRLSYNDIAAGVRQFGHARLQKPDSPGQYQLPGNITSEYMRRNLPVDFYDFLCTVQQYYVIMPCVTASESHRVKEIALMALKVRKYDMKRLRNQRLTPQPPLGESFFQPSHALFPDF